MRATTACLLALALAAGGCGKKPEPEAPAPGGAPSSGATPASDNDRLQGVWAIESIQADPPNEAPDRQRMTSTRYQFEGDRLSVAVNGRVWERFLAVGHADQNPKLLVLTRANEKWEPQPELVSAKEGHERVYGDPEKYEWLYRFSEDKLILAETIQPGPRPADFNPRKFVSAGGGKPRIPAVVIVTLAKSTDGRLLVEAPTGTKR